ncbi:MAG: hypothetical protein FJY46_16105, partial [Betaproteobacteria bacterium]|nr:hypothetical protein [Betaproteobacteria bacterium]
MSSNIVGATGHCDAANCALRCLQRRLGPMLLRYLLCSLGLFAAMHASAQSVDVGHSFESAQIVDAEQIVDVKQIVDAEQIVGAELAVEPLSFFKPAESAAVLASDPFEPV